MDKLVEFVAFVLASWRKREFYVGAIFGAAAIILIVGFGEFVKAISG